MAQNYDDHDDDDMPRKRSARRDDWMVCPVCNGNGTTVNPAIDCNGLTAADFAEDPDFAEGYWSGMYDVTCRACNGLRVITEERLEQLDRNAEDRRLAAEEDGRWEDYLGASDRRWG
jgi:hypothetical protein